MVAGNVKLHALAPLADVFSESESGNDFRSESGSDDMELDRSEVPKAASGTLITAQTTALLQL